jgi:hypothetical protein
MTSPAVLNTDFTAILAGTPAATLAHEHARLVTELAAASDALKAAEHCRRIRTALPSDSEARPWVVALGFENLGQVHEASIRTEIANLHLRVEGLRSAAVNAWHGLMDMIEDEGEGWLADLAERHGPTSASREAISTLTAEAAARGPRVYFRDRQPREDR